MRKRVKKKVAKRKNPIEKKAVVEFELPDLDKDPYFIKKAAEVKQLLIEWGDFPPDA